MRPVPLAVLVLACALPALAAGAPASVIRITVTCPGADARTLDETVLSQIYRQINSVEGLNRFETEARSDGVGTVTVCFELWADLDLAEVRVRSAAGEMVSLDKLIKIRESTGPGASNWPRRSCPKGIA